MSGDLRAYDHYDTLFNFTNNKTKHETQQLLSKTKKNVNLKENNVLILLFSVIIYFVQLIVKHNLKPLFITKYSSV